MSAPANLEVGVGQGELAGKVVIKFGAQYIAVQPATARAYAIAFIHFAEQAGLPAQSGPPKESKPAETLLD